MAEWPKTMVIYPSPELRHLAKDIEVIPADLGRELYGVLKNETVECEANGIQPTADAHRVLVRYEREVERGADSDSRDAVEHAPRGSRPTIRSAPSPSLVPEDCEHGYRAAGGTADCPFCAEDTDGGVR